MGARKRGISARTSAGSVEAGRAGSYLGRCVRVIPGGMRKNQRVSDSSRGVVNFLATACDVHVG
jgi:hypothetical protein